jgi:hypothetical protein
MNNAEFRQPQVAQGMHKFVLCEPIKPNRQTDVEGLEGACLLFAGMAHVNAPIDG